MSEAEKKPRTEKTGRVMNKIRTANYIGVNKDTFRTHYLADPEFQRLEKCFGRGHHGWLQEDVDAYLRSCPSAADVRNVG